MPYIGGKVTDLVHAMAEVTPLAARSMAETAGRTLTLRTREGTALGPGTDYGHVRDSWTEKEVERQRSGGIDRYRSGVESHHYRAPGSSGVWSRTGSSPRTPRPSRRQTDRGLALSIRATPVRIRCIRPWPSWRRRCPELLAPELEAWAKAAELNAKRRPGIS